MLEIKLGMKDYLGGFEAYTDPVWSSIYWTEVFRIRMKDGTRLMICFDFVQHGLGLHPNNDKPKYDAPRQVGSPAIAVKARRKRSRWASLITEGQSITIAKTYTGWWGWGKNPDDEFKFTISEAVGAFLKRPDKDGGGYDRAQPRHSLSKMRGKLT